MSDVSVEHVLVVPAELLRRLGYFQGFTQEVNRYLPALLDPSQLSFRPRAAVEHDPGFKQLIPYLIFSHGQGAQRRLFRYTRGSGMGEGRLHRKHSVGVGGHISTDDRRDAVGEAFEQGLNREMREEVVVDTPYTIQCVGLINDDETPVGQVHLGVVHLVDCQWPAVRPREPDLLDSGFRAIGEIMADLTDYETWSAISLRALFGDGAR